MFPSFSVTGTAVRCASSPGCLPVQTPLPPEVKQDGWTIIFALDADVQLPAMREVPLHCEYRGIPLYGRCDAISLHAVHDIKTTQSIDVDRYLESMQWRAYLYMSGRTQFVYDIFKVKRDEKIREMLVTDYVPLRLSAYPGMGRDVEGCLVEFDNAVRALGIPEIMQKKRLAHVAA